MSKEEVTCFYCGKSVSKDEADVVGVDPQSGEDMYWCGCEVEGEDGTDEE